MTIPEKLQQIDQTLIQLLGERLSVLATSDAPLMEEQLTHYKALLMQVGIPESTWSGIVTSCMAALAGSSTLRDHREPPRNITVVGGRGVIGRFFVERLSAAGHHVNILEYDGWDEAERLIGSADLVLVCVSLKATQAVIRRVAQYISPTAMLADVASTKSAIVQSMLESHSGPVLGLHPMFGPGVTSFLSQKVVVCPGRHSEAFQWLQDLITAEGGKLITCTPEEHDRMMVVVQAIRHFSTLSLGVFLAQEGVSINRSLDFASPIYRTEINMVSRLFAQDGSLYIDIMLASEERCEAIDRFVKTGKHLADLLAQADRTTLIDEFEAARETFQAEASRALHESNHTIKHLTNFLAASEVNESIRTHSKNLSSTKVSNQPASHEDSSDNTVGLLTLLSQ